MRGPFVSTDLVPILDQVLANVVYIVIRSFFKYLVCNIQGALFSRNDYHEFFVFSLGFFAERFKSYKSEFTDVHKILISKQKRVGTEK